MENDKPASKNNKLPISLQKDQPQNNRKSISKSDPADGMFVLLGIMTIAALTVNFLASCTRGNIQHLK